MLKVGSPQPPMSNMPPMGDPMPPMGGTMPPMGDPMMSNTPQTGGMNMDNTMGGGSEFDTNFDAGVDADENSDPKKYIQQLTGKLSQSLRKYNSNLPQPDAELCKYVAGMIVKQTTDGLSDGEKKEIIDKVNSNDGVSNDNGNDGMSMDGMNNNPQPQQPPMMESLNHASVINEIFQELIQPENNSRGEIKPRGIKQLGFRKRPFTSPQIR